MNGRTSRSTGLRSGLLLLLLAAPAAAAQDARTSVTIVATGGTISAESETRVSFQDYESGAIPITEMIDELRPEIDEIADLTLVQFGNQGSGGYEIPDLFDLTLAVEEALETADAVVVTSGTSAMDEFVYWLDLTVQSQKPVIITGAMRPWTVIGTDAHANLFNAVVLAASGKTRCFGPVLMLNDEFHAAKDAFKEDAYRMDTFTSRRMGILGFIDEMEVRTYRAPPRIQHCDAPEAWRTPFDLSTITKEDLPRTEALIGYVSAGLDEAVAAWTAAGVEGIVLAGGRPSREAQEDAEAKGVTFVRTNRFRTGQDNLLPQKARMLLMLSLAFSDDREEAMKWYEEIGTREFGSSKDKPEAGF